MSRPRHGGALRCGRRRATALGARELTLRVGLTGGIGSGKTEVGRVFARLGAVVIDADALSREALAPGSAGLRRVSERWPQVVVSGALDRTALGSIVFRDPAALAFLNGIVHPYVRARGAALEAEAGPDRVVVHDIPLLFETRGEASFDATVLVVAPHDVRLERVLARSGLEPGETARRMAAQIDPEAARARATVTIENDASLERLEARARAAYADILARTGAAETSPPDPV